MAAPNNRRNDPLRKVVFKRGNRFELERAIVLILSNDDRVMEYKDKALFCWIPTVELPVHFVGWWPLDYKTRSDPHDVIWKRLEFTLVIEPGIKAFVDGRFITEIDKKDLTSRSLKAIIDFFQPRLVLERAAHTATMSLLGKQINKYSTLAIREMPAVSRHTMIAGKKLIRDIRKWKYKLPDDFRI